MILKDITPRKPGGRRTRAPALAPLGLVVAAWILAATAPLAAHEYWLEPQDFEPAPDARLVAQGQVGQNLEGEVLGYYPEATVHLDLTLGANTVPLTGAVGQVPVVDAPLLGDGLHVLRLQSSNYQTTYPTLAEFATFTEEWDAPWALDAHAANGFPDADIREVFFRYAKALVGAGSAAGSDRALGMPLELVALDNPYADPSPAEIGVELRFDGAPLPDTLVKVFRRSPDGEVALTELTTDAAGRIRVPSAPGFHLVNAVYLDEASPRMQMFLGASWQSLWASLTYAID